MCKIIEAKRADCIKIVMIRALGPRDALVTEISRGQGYHTNSKNCNGKNCNEYMYLAKPTL